MLHQNDWVVSDEIEKIETGIEAGATQFILEKKQILFVQLYLLRPSTRYNVRNCCD